MSQLPTALPAPAVSDGEAGGTVKKEGRRREKCFLVTCPIQGSLPMVTSAAQGLATLSLGVCHLLSPRFNPSEATATSLLLHRGKHGVGRIDIVENRFVGMKSRGEWPPVSSAIPALRTEKKKEEKGEPWRDVAEAQCHQGTGAQVTPTASTAPSPSAFG